MDFLLVCHFHSAFLPGNDLLFHADSLGSHHVAVCLWVAGFEEKVFVEVQWMPFVCRSRKDGCRVESEDMKYKDSM